MMERKDAMRYGILIAMLFASAVSEAQFIEQGASEVQVWTSGGHSVSGGRGDFVTAGY